MDPHAGVLAFVLQANPGPLDTSLAYDVPHSFKRV